MFLTWKKLSAYLYMEHVEYLNKVLVQINKKNYDLSLPESWFDEITSFISSNPHGMQRNGVKEFQLSLSWLYPGHDDVEVLAGIYFPKIQMYADTL